MTRIGIAITAIALSGCAGMVTANDGDQVTIEHDGFVSATGAAAETAAKSCAQAGKSKATLTRTVSKNPAFPVGSGVQVSTYRCS